MRSDEGLLAVRNSQIKLTPDEHQMLTRKAEDAGLSLQVFLRRLVRIELGLEDSQHQRSPEDISYHDKLDYVFEHGDSDDRTGIQKNLDWAVNDIRSRAWALPMASAEPR